MTDLLNCVQSTSVVIAEPPLLQLTLNSQPEILGGQNGSVSVIAQGGVFPYSYLWSNGSTQSSIDSLSVGTYTVTVTDNHGCSIIDSIDVFASNCAFSMSLVVINPSCFGESDGIIIPQIVIPGAEPYFFQWSDDTHDVILLSLIHI